MAIAFSAKRINSFVCVVQVGRGPAHPSFKAQGLSPLALAHLRRQLVRTMLVVERQTHLMLLLLLLLQC
jgi:hypothetical protein